MATSHTVNILDLPFEILEKIVEKCSYDEIAGHRLVGKIDGMFRNEINVRYWAVCCTVQVKDLQIT